MIRFTQFHVLDRYDSTLRIPLLMISFANKFYIYHVVRRRTLTSVCLSQDSAPHTLINTDNLIRWIDSRGYTVDEADKPVDISYAQAVELTNDRHDMHMCMRNLFTPMAVHHRSLDYMVRDNIGKRVSKLLESYARRHDANFALSHRSDREPCATYKGGYYYGLPAFMHVRTAFRDFGHMIAHYRAGGDDHSIEDVRSAFFALDDKYHDFTSHIDNAFSATSSAADERLDDLEIKHCDCGHYENEGDTHTVRNDEWCDNCFDEDAVYVEDQDEYWPRDDAYYSDRDDCYYSYDHDDDDDDDNEEDERERAIMSYSTNVISMLGKTSGITSSHFGEFTMGIELEMTSGENDSYSAAESVRSRLGSDYCIIKSDGSLPHNGFEVVTSPQGLSTHIDKFKAWDIDPAYRAWNTGKCGMHVHIDSRAFTQLTMGKFLMFINSQHNVDFIRKIAGRHPSVDDQARSYCAAEHQSILINPKQAVKGKSGERYRMVNLCNLGVSEARRLGLSLDNSYNGKYNTVELRIFRASLKKERLLAQIEFTHAAVMFCRVASWRDLNGASFIKWLRTVVGQYPALTKWYGVRQIHTSTPTVIAPAEATCADSVPPAPSGVSAQTSMRHDHEYPMHIPYDSEGEAIRTWARRADLYFRFALYSGSEYAYFPYGDMDTISRGDVVYERFQDQWVLMSEGYANALSSCSYVVSENQPV
jgi:hypothetical protein